jgi:hypothetical protein
MFGLLINGGLEGIWKEAVVAKLITIPEYSCRD